jgi:AcrR family transcriptional regulator
MPKGFTDREKEHIRGSLIEKGKALFGTYGVKKTNVEDLTSAAGISKGAFYLFYTSKEELFFEILVQFEEEYHAMLLEIAAGPATSARQQVKDFLQHAFTIWRTHPLFQHFSQEEYEYLLRKLPAEKVQANLRKDDLFVNQLLAQWHERGVVIDCDPAMFLGLMHALFFISLHEGDFEPGMYPPLIDFFVDMIAERIVREF